MLSEIPEGWRSSRIGELTELQNGYGFKSKDWAKSGLPIIRIQNLNGGGEFNYFNGDYDKKYLVEEGDLLFCWSGSRGTSFGARFWKQGKGLLNQHIFKCIPKDGVRKPFLYYMLDWMTAEIEREAHGGAGLAHIKKSEMVQFPCALPPSSEQSRIAEILSSVDASIRATQAVIEQAERVKRGLMEELLTGGLSGEAIERGEAPAGWKSTTIGALTELQNGYGFKSKDWAEDGLPIIRIQNLNGGGDFNYFNGDYDEKYVVQKGDLLFCWSGSRGTSFGARYWTQDKGLLNQHIFKCIPKKGVEKAYLYYLLDWMTVAIEKEAHGGAGLAHIKKSEMVAFSCCTPPVSEQERIAGILSNADELIAKQKAIVEQQARTKRGMMDDLLTGKVRTV